MAVARRDFWAVKWESLRNGLTVDRLTDFATYGCGFYGPVR